MTPAFRRAAALLLFSFLAVNASTRPPVSSRPRPSERDTAGSRNSATAARLRPSTTRKATPRATARPSAARASAPRVAAVRKPAISSDGLPDAVKLLIGAGGIYGAFLYYGSLQEDIFRYAALDGAQFKQAWFLQVLEALANVIVGFGGMSLVGATKDIPLKMFGISGAAQVAAKACTSLALANGLSFSVATLAKSGKMAPVMAGSVLLGGASYTMREYVQVAAIIVGTAVVSLGQKRGPVENSLLGVSYILLSLALDGVTAGFQKRVKMEIAKAGVTPQPYDFMFWTNLFMCISATLVALSLGELEMGVMYCMQNPAIMSKILKFCICSAVGQSFIFYTIINFDPLVLSTVTTTRKIFSVLLGFFFKGHYLSPTGWSGVTIASAGIIADLQDKFGGDIGGSGKLKKKKETRATASRAAAAPRPRPKKTSPASPRPRPSAARR